jgi:hypothetical protein
MAPLHEQWGPPLGNPHFKEQINVIPSINSATTCPEQEHLRIRVCIREITMYLPLNIPTYPYYEPSNSYFSIPSSDFSLPHLVFFFFFSFSFSILSSISPILFSASLSSSPSNPFSASLLVRATTGPRQ